MFKSLAGLGYAIARGVWSEEKADGLIKQAENAYARMERYLEVKHITRLPATFTLRNNRTAMSIRYAPARKYVEKL